MSITSMFNSISWPWSNSTKPPAASDQARAPEPTLDPPLVLKLSDGWNKAPTNPTDIGLVRKHDNEVDFVRSIKNEVEKTGSLAASLDNSPSDRNETKGTVLLDSSAIPKYPGKDSPSSILIEFDESHVIKQADIRYQNPVSYEGTGGGETRYAFEAQPDGQQKLSRTRTGVTMTGGDNHFENYKRGSSVNVNTDGTLTSSFY